MRHRSTKNGHIYDPQDREKASTYFDIFRQYKAPPLDGPLCVSFIFSFAPPCSWSKKKSNEALAGKHQPAVKPDISNLIKFYEDCMNGLIYIDDAQIVEVRARKVYALDAGTKITVEGYDRSS